MLVVAVEVVTDHIWSVETGCRIIAGIRVRALARRQAISPIWMAESPSGISVHVCLIDHRRIDGELDDAAVFDCLSRCAILILIHEATKGIGDVRTNHELIGSGLGRRSETDGQHGV